MSFFHDVSDMDSVLITQLLCMVFISSGNESDKRNLCLIPPLTPPLTSECFGCPPPPLSPFPPVGLIYKHVLCGLSHKPQSLCRNATVEAPSKSSMSASQIDK